MNAAERFLQASRAHDHDAVAALLAPDVVLRNPVTDEMVCGPDAVVASLRKVAEACDEFRHSHLLGDTGLGDGPLYAMVFRARVGEHTLEGVDLIELDDADRIVAFTALARPMGALMELGARMATSD